MMFYSIFKKEGGTKNVSPINFPGIMDMPKKLAQSICDVLNKEYTVNNTVKTFPDEYYIAPSSSHNIQKDFTRKIF